jgi:O-succinylbenzoic acid--CoA ligase
VYRSLTHLPVRRDPASTTALLDALRRALDGSGPALAPVDALTHDGDPADPGGGRTGLPTRVSTPLPGQLPTHVPDEVALVVTTSGSTGPGRAVLLDARALLASAHATHERLAGPGRWVLALPLTHIAGLQVLLRSVVAGTAPVVLDPGAFDPAAFCAATAAALSSADEPVYTSLVPTQVHRLLGWAEQTGGSLAPLRGLAAVLVGGAATAPATLDRAREHGLPVVTTYGMTETCGGCVYDGVPLAGVRVGLDDGVVRLAGPVLARGYADGHDEAFSVDGAGVRWFTTRDLGRLDGTLEVLGRADDVIVTGGEKVPPAAVEAVVVTLPGVADACVVGLPDDEWGQVVTAVVVLDRAAGGPAPTLEQVRALVSRTLWNAAAPRRLLVVDALPERGPGKVDRAEVARRAAAASV